MEQNKKDIPLFVKFIIVFLLIFCLVLLIASSINTTANNPDNKKNVINKSNFIGTWALTVDTAKLHHIKVNDELEGIEITIDNETYALTRNIEDKEFLPNNLWLDAEFEQVGQYKVCNDVMLDKKICKKSLSDIINYAEKLPIEN